MKILEAYSHHSGAVWVFFRYGNKKESWETKIDSAERHDSSNISCRCETRGEGATAYPEPGISGPSRVRRGVNLTHGSFAEFAVDIGGRVSQYAL